MILLIAVAGLGWYFLVYAPAHVVPAEVAYVLPLSVTVVDTPAQIRLDVTQLRNGDQVQVLSRTRNWAHVRVDDGRTGWLELKDLIDSQTYQRGRQELRDMEKIQPQASGHTSNEVNLRLDPSRQSAQLALLGPNEQLQIFGRRYVERASKDSDSPSTDNNDQGASAAVREAWYWVRAGSRGGWVLGRYITLDVPPEISQFAQDVNMVAWLVLDNVPDNGRLVPQYLVADRMEAPQFDFNHIRVFTWWPKNQEYVTAFVESNVPGFFPILVSRVDDKPVFRLRLVDKKGHRYQKIFGMENTIVHPLGKVDGWESHAMPSIPVRRSRRRNSNGRRR
ncbi:MAG TPA: SH3 domain-containing protein [Terriglobia bacterium]|nr:SH3 domain-containing protein [Terriglobia bacterium]